MRFTLVSTLVAFLAAGCGGAGNGTPAGSGSAVRDSAGITIVENAGPAWPAGSGWRIADAPVTEAGGTTPEGDLVNVAAAVRLPDQRVAVASGSVIRIFGPDGSLEKRMGQEGAGPGEYRSLTGLWAGPGDSLLAADMMLFRMTVVDPTTGAARNFSLGGQTAPSGPSAGAFGMAIPVGQLGDGSVLGMRMSFDLTAQHDGIYRDTVAFLRYGRDGAGEDTVARKPGIEMQQASLTFNGRTVPTPSPVPLGRTTVAAAGLDRVYLTTNDAWEIEVRNPDGSLRRLIRVASPPSPVTDADKTAHRKEQIDALEATPQFRAIPEQFKQQFIDRVNSANYPETKPWIAALFPVSDGSLWVEEVTTPGAERRQYAVIDGDGVLLGRVLAPPRLRILSVYPDAVVGVWRDPDDVERVRVHRIER